MQEQISSAEITFARQLVERLAVQRLPHGSGLEALLHESLRILAR